MKRRSTNRLYHSIRKNSCFIPLLIALVFFALFGGCDKTPKSVIVATVADSSISMDIINTIFNENKDNLTLGLEQEILVKRTILDNLIEKQLLALAAIDSGLHRQEGFARRMERKRRDIVVNIYFDDMVNSQVEPSPEELETFRRQTVAKVNMQLLKLYSPFDTVMNVYERLVSGEDFKSIALNYSTDSFSRSKAGVTGFQSSVFYLPKMRSVIDTLPVGVFSQPFFENDAYWIIKVMDKKIEPEPFYEPNDRSLFFRLLESNRLQRTLELTDSLWNANGCKINDSVVRLYEDRITGKVSYGASVNISAEFTDDEKALDFVRCDDLVWSFGEFLKGFEQVNPAFYPHKEDSPSYIRFAKRNLFEKMLYHSAEASGYLDDPRYKVQWRLTYMRSLADFMQGRLYSEIDITDKEIHDYYQANLLSYKEPTKIRVDEIRLKSLDEAKSVMKKFKNGADFGRLARKHSIRRSTADRGGDLGWTNSDRYAVYYYAAMDSGIGAVIGPIKDGIEYGIIKITDKVPSRTKDYNLVRQDIRKDLLAVARDSLKNALLDELKSEFAVEINYQLLETTVKSGRKSA
ncbi:MAG: hypothetical protein GF315_06500 [candidate division Zixibacteria bacterium]|nr:hypothetical protein [candidate division Zixibacteria bacterium]